MPVKTTLVQGILALIAALGFASFAAADDIELHHGYARIMPNAKSGAIFFTIVNFGAEDDRLIGARTPIARKAELHTHIAGDDGVMKMREVEGGLPVTAGGHHELKRGGDHVMLMGLTDIPAQGQDVEVVLVFEKAGEITLVVKNDLERKDEPMDHSQHMSNGKMKMPGQGQSEGN